MHHKQAMIVAATPLAPLPALARKRHRANRKIQPITSVSEKGDGFSAGFEGVSVAGQGRKSSNSGTYTGVLPDEAKATAAPLSIPTTDTEEARGKQREPKPLLPSTVKAHVQAARISQSGLIASPTTVQQATRLPSPQRAAMVLRSPPKQQQPPPPQRIYHEYLRLKRTWSLKEAEGEEGG